MRIHAAAANTREGIDVEARMWILAPRLENDLIVLSILTRIV
jgi:hypothetical protein